MNRYKVARLIAEDLNNIMREQGFLNNSLRIKLVAEKHLADRVLDRKIELASLHLMFRRLFSRNICQVLYASERSFIETQRTHSKAIAVSYRDYILCITVKKHSCKEYTVKLRTLLWHANTCKFEHIIDIN